MVPLSIFVSYDRNDTGFAQYLIETLRSAGAMVMDDPAGVYGAFLERELAHCQWFILVQTTDALRSSHVLVGMIAALDLEAQGKIKILRIVAPLAETLSTWSHTSAITLNDDYPSAGDKVLEKLGLRRVEKYSSNQSLSLPSQHHIAGCFFSLVVIGILAFAGVYFYPTIAALISKPPSDPLQVYSWATNKQPFFTDPLTSQDENKWFEGVGLFKSSCKFINGVYYGEVPTHNTYNFCGANADEDNNFGNFAFQAQITIDGDAGGLVFRADQSPDPNNFYAFTICIDPSCGQGTYNLSFCQKKCSRLLKFGSSAAIKLGGQTNLLTVVAFGSDLYLYINTQFVYKVSDTALSSGYIGMTAYSSYNSRHDTKVKFSQAEVWKL